MCLIPTVLNHICIDTSGRSQFTCWEGSTVSGPTLAHGLVFSNFKLASHHLGCCQLKLGILSVNVVNIPILNQFGINAWSGNEVKCIIQSDCKPYNCLYDQWCDHFCCTVAFSMLNLHFNVITFIAGVIALLHWVSDVCICNKMQTTNIIPAQYNITSGAGPQMSPMLHLQKP